MSLLTSHKYVGQFLPGTKRIFLALASMFLEEPCKTLEQSVLSMVIATPGGSDGGGRVARNRTHKDRQDNKQHN